MRTYATTWSIGSLCLLSGLFLSRTVHAQLFRIEERHPTELRQIEDELEKIEEDLEEAQCGGWDFDVPIEDTDVIVEGAPGRQWVQDGNIRSGMAEREEEGGLFEDGFLFPKTDEAQGWSTACTEEQLADFHYAVSPENCEDPAKCKNLCANLNRWHRMVQVCNVNGRYVETADQRGCFLNFASPPNPVVILPGECRTEFHYCCTDALVTYTGYDTVTDGRHPDASRNCLQCRGDGAVLEGEEFDFNGESLRRDERNEIGCRWGAQPNTGTPSPIYITVPVDSPIPRPTPQPYPQPSPSPGNTTASLLAQATSTTPISPGGSDTITVIAYGPTVGGTPDPIPIPTSFSRLPPRQGNQYQSFFRRYTASHTREITPNYDKDDHQRFDVPLACYGPYREFDPKRETADGKRAAGDQGDPDLPAYNCTIGEDYSTMVETQQNLTHGVGSYGKDEADNDWPDPEYPPKDREFDEESDLWDPRGGSAISLLNDTVFREAVDSDLVVAALGIDSATQRATVQLTEDVPLSQGRLLRPIDDSVSNERGDERTVAEWWTKTQNAMNRLLTEPMLRVLLPIDWALDLDPNDPILRDKRTLLDEYRRTLQDPQERKKWITNPLTRTVEIQLEIDDYAEIIRGSLMDEIKEFLERSLILPIEQVRVAIPVINQSPVRLRAVRDDWCAFALQGKEGDADCDSIGGPIGELMARLEEHADRHDEIRTVRSDLVIYVTALIKRQQKIRTAIGEWMQENEDDYEAYRQRLAQRLGDKDGPDIRKQWIDTQSAWYGLHDVAAFGWCRSERLGPEQYLQLDSWLPGRPDLRGEDLPEIIVGNPEDLILDLTTLKRPDRPLLLPVIDIVPVDMDLPTPDQPGPEGENRDPNNPLIIPSVEEIVVPSLADKVDDIIPQVQVELHPLTIGTLAGENFGEYEGMEIEEISEKLEESREIITKALERYVKTWVSLLSKHPRGGDADLRCPEMDEGHCVFTEMELRETLAGIGAPPMMLRDRDPEAHRNEREGVGVCTSNDDKDWVCIPAPPEQAPDPVGWQVRIPEQADEVEAMRPQKQIDESFLDALSDADDAVPLDSMRGDVILPSLGTNASIELVAPEEEDSRSTTPRSP